MKAAQQAAIAFSSGSLALLFGGLLAAQEIRLRDCEIAGANRSTCIDYSENSLFFPEAKSHSGRYLTRRFIINETMPRVRVPFKTADYLRLDQG